MRRLVIVLSIVVLTLFILVPVASAHVWQVDTGNGGCVVLGSGEPPPVDQGVSPHTRGLAHAAHAGQGNSAVQHGSC